MSVARGRRLNHERYEEEMRRGLHEKKLVKSVKKAKTSKKKSTDTDAAAPRLFEKGRKRMPDTNPSQATVQKLITPHDQFIRSVFNMQRSYYIDIYQREYKWTDMQVKTLLNDLEVRFELGKRGKTDPKEIQQDVLENFEPYFLNTYLTHTSPTATGIVDGQQRLTTILLMLIKLYQILQQVETNPESRGKTFTAYRSAPLDFRGR